MSNDNILWVDPFKYTAGEPFRIFPVGEFKRGSRTLSITKERLSEMKANYDANRPRWKAPIYAGHPTDTNPDPPKLGNVSKLELRDDGLYATPEYSDKGKELIGDESYQYVSPGVLWSLAGGKYADEQGNEFDNVLDHVALTNRPFFGSKTAVFSSDASLVESKDVSLFAGTEEELEKLAREIIQKIIPEQFREFDTEMRKEMADKGTAMDDGSYPIANTGDLKNAIQAFGRSKNKDATKAHIIKRAKALGKTDMLPEDWTKEKGGNMSDNIVQPEAFAELTKKVEEMAEALKSKDEQFAAEKARADKLEADNKSIADKFAAEQKSRRIDALTVQAETFAHLSVKPDEFAQNFYALETALPEVAKWFMEKFNALENQASTGTLFAQVTSRNAKTEAETFESAVAKTLKEEFGNDMAKYADAAKKVSIARPDLFAEYSNTYTPPRKELR